MPDVRQKEKVVDPVYKYIGRQLRRFRTEHNSTQSDVAKIIGVSSAQYFKYEEGYSKCSITNLLTLSKHYGIEIDSILPVAKDAYQDKETKSTTSDAPKGEADPELVEALPSDSELLAELISTFMKLKDRSSRETLVQFLKTL